MKILLLCVLLVCLQTLSNAQPVQPGNANPAQAAAPPGAHPADGGAPHPPDIGPLLVNPAMSLLPGSPVLPNFIAFDSGFARALLPQFPDRNINMMGAIRG